MSMARAGATPCIRALARKYAALEPSGMTGPVRSLF